MAKTTKTTTTKTTKATTKAPRKAAAKPTPVEEVKVDKSFWSGDYPDGEFTCRVCGDPKEHKSFTVVTVWDDDSRTRRTECRSCEATRIGS